MANEDIKKYAKESNVKMWQIANALNINDGNFSRKLRLELSEFEKSKIMQIIDNINQNNERGIEMANLTQCDFCKKTQTNSNGFRYLHIKCRKESYKTLSEFWS